MAILSQSPLLFLNFWSSSFLNFGLSLSAYQLWAAFVELAQQGSFLPFHFTTWQRLLSSSPSQFWLGVLQVRRQHLSRGVVIVATTTPLQGFDLRNLCHARNPVDIVVVEGNNGLVVSRSGGLHSSVSLRPLGRCIALGDYVSALQVDGNVLVVRRLRVLAYVLLCGFANWGRS